MTLRQEIESLTPALRRIARALVLVDGQANTEASDDLVHETLLRALKFESPAQGITPRAWIYALLIGLNRQHVRAHAASAGLESGAAHHLLRGNEGRSAGLRRAAGTSLPMGNAATCLQSLELEEREAMLLVVLESLSYAQAAQVLGLPRATLVARLARARASLTACMGKGARQDAHAAPSHLRLVR